MQLSSKFTFITFSTDSIFGNSQQSREQPNTNRSLVIVIIIIITDVIIIIMADVFSLSMQMSHFHDNALLVGLAAVSDRVSVLSVYYCAFIPQEETSSSRFIVTLFSVFGKSLLFWFSWFQDFDPNRTEKVSDLKILSWGASAVFFNDIYIGAKKNLFLSSAQVTVKQDIVQSCCRYFNTFPPPTWNIFNWKLNILRFWASNRSLYYEIRKMNKTWEPFGMNLHMFVCFT